MYEDLPILVQSVGYWVQEKLGNPCTPNSRYACAVEIPFSHSQAQQLHPDIRGIGETKSLKNTDG